AANRLAVEEGRIRVGGRTVPEGTTITIDGTSGEVALGAQPTMTGTTDPRLAQLRAWEGQNVRLL
ncbi:hypothetical protein ACFQ1S_26230, partial [Kibdelosporangium lantanae]